MKTVGEVRGKMIAYLQGLLSGCEAEDKQLQEAITELKNGGDNKISLLYVVSKLGGGEET